MSDRVWKSFGSDNNSGASPEVIEAIAAANVGHAVGYGEDPITRRAEAAFKEEFGPKAETFFVFNGTGANVLALSLASGPSQAVLCAKSAHIAVDETGAPEAAGIKVMELASEGGRLRLEALEEALGLLGNPHHAQPSCVSISQTTENGAVYAPAEIRRIAELAHGRGLRLHMDGARLANAAAALGLGLAEASTELGVDLLSFGGMKNGVAFGEALVVLDPELARRAPYLRKARLQLASKMRFISAQYLAYLSDGLWRRNALAANRAAARLAAAIGGLPGLELAAPPAANALFVRMPAAAVEALRRDYFFYDWEDGLVRFVTSFDTSDGDVDAFARAIAAALGRA